MSERNPYTVLVAVDGTEAALPVLLHAINTATHYPAVDLQVATVIPKSAWRGPPVEDDQVRNAERNLAEFLGEALNSFEGLDISDWRVQTIVRAGDVRDELCFLAEWGQVDLVVVGREQLAGDQSSSSGVTRALVEQVNCPVLVVKPKEHRPSQDIDYTGSGKVLSMSSWMVPTSLFSSGSGGLF